MRRTYIRHGFPKHAFVKHYYKLSGISSKGRVLPTQRNYQVRTPVLCDCNGTLSQSGWMAFPRPSGHIRSHALAYKVSRWRSAGKHPSENRNYRRSWKPKEPHPCETRYYRSAWKPLAKHPSENRCYRWSWCEPAARRLFGHMLSARAYRAH